VAGVSPAAGQKKAGKIEKETLMFFIKPQRHKGIKIKMKYIC
jgi:hypothetical protein